jgi:exonuclease SbcC
MRPRELTLEGFRSYRGSTTFDWRDRRLVGIVGPIGAGKSSILDAISFALYGKTPNVERDTKSLIHQLCEQCHVELKFEVDGQTWRAQRALRRKGQAGHRLELLAGDEPDAEVVERVTGERDVNARVEQLLGMDFKAFSRSVLLAQNRFHEFLRATAGDRDKVLKGVFGYDRLDDAQRVAKVRLATVELELDGFQRERQGIDRARADLDDARATAEVTRERLARLDAAADEVERLTKERAAADADMDAADTRVADLLAIAEGLPPEEDLMAVAAAAESAGVAVAGAREALEAAKRERAAAESGLADVTSRLGDRKQFSSFEALVRTQDAQVKERQRAEATTAAAVAAVADATTIAQERTAESEAGRVAADLAAVSLTTAEAGLEAARATVLAAHHAEMARTLLGELRPGDPCPVCDQPVHAVPKAARAPKVAAAEKALAKAGSEADAARSAREDAAAALASAQTAADAATVEIAKAEEAARAAADEQRAAEAALAATQSQVVEWLGEEGDVHELFEAREAELTAAEQALEAAKEGVERAQEEFDGSKEREAGAAERLATLANRLAGSWGRLGHDRPVPAEAGAVRASFVDLREAVVAAHDDAAARAGEARDRSANAAAAAGDLLAGLDLPADADFGAARTEAGIRYGTAAAHVQELEDRIATAGELEGRIVAAEARRDIADRLARDLQPSRFLAFLLEEERAELADLGSEHFDRLTDGGFRFSQDDLFDILDLNAAGQTRKADSLSGGETFLASLALALALAEMVARDGGRLDAFFLDEGFGSLDPEHLDRAMEGIGRLVADNEQRLVVLVSHVAEMREAIEDLVILDKDGVTGDTVVRSGAALP